MTHGSSMRGWWPFPFWVMLAVAPSACKTLAGRGDDSAVKVRNGVEAPRPSFATVADVTLTGPVDGKTQIRQCTGTLLCPNVLLTAAHCLRSFASAPSLELNFWQASPPANASVAAGKGLVIIPPQYDQNPSYHYDMALVVLDRAPGAFVATDFYAFADREPRAGDQITIAGYGETGGPDDGSLRIRTGSMTIVSYRDRLEARGPAAPDAPVLEMRPNRQGQMICRGDSGGPALSQSGGTPQLLGVAGGQGGSRLARWIHGECKGSSTAHFASVRHLAPWLRQNMAQHCQTSQVPE